MKIKPIRTEKDHAEALRAAERIADAKPGSADRDLLEVLSMLIEQYERAEFPIEAPSPIEAIKFRLEQHGLTRSALLPIFGSTGRISEILSGARPLNLLMVYRLHNELGIPYQSLIKPMPAKKRGSGVPRGAKNVGKRAPGKKNNRGKKIARQGEVHAV